MADELVLGESLEALIDHRGKTPAKLGSDFVDSGVPVASALLVKNGQLDLTDARYVDLATFERWMPIQIKSGDVLLTSEAPLGRVARVQGDEPLVLGQRLFGLRGRPGVLDSGYLYYALQTARVQGDLIGRSTGTTVFGIRQSALRSLAIPAPAYPEQKVIGEALSTLDEKIAANDRVRSLSLELSAAEYELSLVSGVTETAVGDIAEFHNRRRVPLSSREREERSGCVPYYGAAGRLDWIDEALFEGQFVLVGEDGTVMRQDGGPVVQYIWGPAWVNNHAHVLAGRSISTELLRLAIERESVAHIVTGAVQPKISMGNLKALRVSMPADTSKLEKVVQRLAALTRSLVDENVRLAATRDELLPLLMSGKVRVSDAEKVMEEVL